MLEASEFRIDSLNFSEAVNDVVQALSNLTNVQFTLKKMHFSQEDIYLLPSFVGDRKQPMAVSFFEVGGDLEGYILVLVPVNHLDSLLETLIGQTDLDKELSDSVIGEIGNILASTFVSNLADQHYLRVVPTPPQVALDMVGAILDTVATDLASENDFHNQLASDSVPIVLMEFAGVENELDLIMIGILKMETRG